MQEATNLAFTNEHDDWSVNACIGKDSVSLTVRHDGRQLVVMFDGDGKVTFDHECSVDEIDEYWRAKTACIGPVEPASRR